MRIWVRQNAHLLGPIEPRNALVDTLASRLHDIPELHAIRRSYIAITTGSAEYRWPLPDQPHPALRRVLAGHTNWVVAGAVSPDGRWLATSSWDGTARIWDSDTGEALAAIRVDGAINACMWLPDNSGIAIAGDARVYLFDFTPKA